MTKKEFKRAMQCGLGRCILELHTTDQINRYRDIVLWGCTHNLSYDTQCEGTRSYYLYQLVNCFPDVSYFVNTVITYFYKNLCHTGWEFLQFCDFLELFAAEGNLTATNALQEGYYRLYDILIKKRKKTTTHTLPERDNFESLCISIVNISKTTNDCIDRYLEVAEHIGLLILENPLFTDWHFDWFQTHWEQELGKSKIRTLLKRKAKASTGLSYYWNDLQKWEQSGKQCAQNYRQSLKNTTAQTVYNMLQNGALVGKNIPLMVARRMKQEGQEAQKLADYYQQETNLSVRTSLLHLLSIQDCSQLLDATSVIADSQSDYPALKEYAFKALATMRDDKIHAYAWELLHKKERITDVIYMLANNYQKTDRTVLITLIKSLPVTYQEVVAWHGPFLAVLNLLETGHNKHAPRELLPYLYEHTLCSCCREYILREMKRRKMLTHDLLQECLYDSSETIRNFAKKSSLLPMSY